MEIGITGASVVSVGQVFQVIYQGRMVFQNSSRQLCVAIALDSEYLASVKSNVFSIAA